MQVTTIGLDIAKIPPNAKYRADLVCSDGCTYARRIGVPLLKKQAVKRASIWIVVQSRSMLLPHGSALGIESYSRKDALARRC
jgi:hypothetical protein